MDRVFIILSSADYEVHKELSFRLALNAHTKKWADEVRVLIWGPTEKILAENKQFQEEVKLLIEAGIDVFACKACSDNYGVSDALTQLGVKVEYVGRLTIQMLKEGWHQLTF
ncbi:MAG: DsrE family protein [Candidatus Heimdallarchaeota archaeon]